MTKMLSSQPKSVITNHLAKRAPIYYFSLGFIVKSDDVVDRYDILVFRNWTGPFRPTLSSGLMKRAIICIIALWFDVLLKGFLAVFEP